MITKERPPVKTPIRYVGGTWDGHVEHLPAPFLDGHGTFRDAPVDGMILTEDYGPLEGNPGTFVLKSSTLMHEPGLYRLKERLPDGMSVAEAFFHASEFTAQSENN